MGVVLLGLGLGIGQFFSTQSDFASIGFVAVLGLVVGSIMGFIAITRFWWVVVALFFLRSSLDSFRLGNSAGGAGSNLSPSIVAGAVFLGGGTLWLFAKWRAGELHRMSRPTRWFLGFAIVTVLSAGGSTQPVSTVVSASKVLAGALMFAVLEQAYREKPERLKVVLAAAGASLVIPAFVSVRQLMTGPEAGDFVDVGRIRGTFVHPNPFASYLVLIAPVALALYPHLSGRQRRAAQLVGAVAGLLTLFTYTRGAWGALLISVLYIGWKQDKRIIVGMFVLMAVVFIAVPSVSTRLADLDNQRQVGQGDPNSLAWRFDYWARLLPMTADSPLIGIGLDQVLVTSEEKLQPHNSLVQAMVETGLLGFVMLSGFIITAALDLRYAIRTAAPGLPRGVAIASAAAALGLLVQMLSENLLTQAVLHWYLAAVLAWPLAMVCHVRDRQRENEATEGAESSGDNGSAGASGEHPLLVPG